MSLDFWVKQILKENTHALIFRFVVFRDEALFKLYVQISDGTPPFKNNLVPVMHSNRITIANNNPINKLTERVP